MSNGHTQRDKCTQLSARLRLQPFKLGDRVAVPHSTAGMASGGQGAWFEGICEKVDLRCAEHPTAHLHSSRLAVRLGQDAIQILGVPQPLRCFEVGNLLSRCVLPCKSDYLCRHFMQDAV